jgi:hypothetical protein
VSCVELLESTRRAERTECRAAPASAISLVPSGSRHRWTIFLPSSKAEGPQPSHTPPTPSPGWPSQVLSLEPDNRDAMRELRELRSKLAQQRKKEQKK